MGANYEQFPIPATAGMAHNIFKIDIASLSLDNCSTIKVLDEKRKCLEILQNEKGRCFLSLVGSPILEYKDL